MILQIILLIFGFIILIKGADYFVDGGSGIAGNLKVSKMLIGLTIVAFGTSAPEFAVSVKSLLSGNTDMVLGNVIGSNILNILLILGLSALFHSLKVKENTVKKEIPITLMITTAFAVLMCDNFFDKNISSSFTRGDGLILVLFFSVFMYYVIGMAKNKVEDDIEEYPSMRKSILLCVCGLVGIVFGSSFVVDSASELAKMFGVSERMISLTIVALGTSLPEIVTSVSATRKGQYDIAIGNVVGSNIFNVGIVIGLPILLFGGINNISFSYIDIVVMVISTLFLFIYSFNDKNISKKEGIKFLLLFVIYYSYVIFM